MSAHQVTYLFPNMLRQSRQSAGLQQQVLAAFVGIDPQFLCSLEKGRRIGPADQLVQQICKALDLNEPQFSALRNAALHDRAVKWLTAHVTPDAAAFFGSCVTAAVEPPAATQTAPLMATQTAPPGRGELTH